MQKDVFGARGDFTTSPEISQVFGEVGNITSLSHFQPSLPHVSCHLSLSVVGCVGNG